MIQIEQTITSVEVAEMVNKRHTDLIRDIRRYSEQLAESKIALSDFFTESTYKDSTGRALPCYNVTKKGCEFIAHKLTGTKGTEFTARYINRFHDMEEHIQHSKPRTALEQLQLQSKAILEVNDKIDEVKQELEDFKQDMPLMNIECDRITTAVRKVGTRALGGKDSNAYHDKSLSGKVYTDIYRELKRQFQVTSYKSIKRRQCDTAISIIESYQLPVVLKEQIQNSNAQMNMEVL
jgi:Rha family phage regulatory protein